MTRPSLFLAALLCAASSIAAPPSRSLSEAEGPVPERSRRATDIEGRLVKLPAPPQRIVSLAPAITENLFALGVGSRIVGTVEFSNYPEAAKKIRQIGSYERFDLEAIVALKPDLVIGWQSGNPAAQLARVRSLGFPLFLDDAQRLDEIPASLLRLGAITGAEATAVPLANRLRGEIAGLRERYGQRPPVRVFYEIWRSPLITVGGPQLITDVLRVCGGDNVFGQLDALAPTVSVEAVIAADPEAIIGAGSDEFETGWIEDWKKWSKLTAVARGNLYPVDPNGMHRATPRLFPEMRKVCDSLEQARRKRPLPQPAARSGR